MAAQPQRPASLEIEANGINVIPESERHGTPRSLFWPWATASIALFNMSIAGLLFVFGLGFIPAALAALIGICASFFLVGIVALAGKRASAPTMVISRAAFGVHGNALPTLVSYLTLVGWEIVTVSTTVLAAVTVFARLGVPLTRAGEVIVFVIAIAVIICAGVFGFRLVSRFQGVVTIASIGLTIAFIALTIGDVNWPALLHMGDVSGSGLAGAAIVSMAAFGLGWVNSGADYSRYLPRTSSSGAIVAWTTFAGSLVPVVLVTYGLMLVASNSALAGQLADNPVGALVTLLPTSYLILLPLLLILSLSTTGSGAMDLYSSGLALLTLGLRVPRAVAAGIDGILMALGSVFLMWFATSFFGPFESFLIFLGVPLAAWAGVFIADTLMRSGDYASPDFFDARGRYGSIGWPALISMIVATLIGWGLVTATVDSPILDWQGFVFDLFAVPTDSFWRSSNIGILVAIAIGFLGCRLFNGRRVRRQQALASTAPVSSASSS